MLAVVWKEVNWNVLKGKKASPMQNNKVSVVLCKSGQPFLPRNLKVGSWAGKELTLN